MESEIHADAPLNYVEFQLFPNQDRYEACACSDSRVDKVASGLLGQLVSHVPELKDHLSRGSNASFRIRHPKDLDSSQWFTKSTLTRFLHFVASMDILSTTTSIENEITQLEETRKFHLSLYTKENNEIMPPDASKNELLRAVDLRLTALRAELAAVIDHAAGSTCSSQHISKVVKLSQHLGDSSLSNTLHKIAELVPMDEKVDLPIDVKLSSTISLSNDWVDKSDNKTEVKKPSGPDTPVKYGVSPAKAAQIERQNSTGSEKSSNSSEDDQLSVERSRSLIRSASPRRSASPMRRVQIGRSGSRKATALTIKSLNYFPGRDRSQTYTDAATYSSEEEGSEKPPQKSNSNALRMSVKDKISLFENKQKDKISDVQKKRSTIDASSGTNKFVLRRWSSDMGNDSSQRHAELVSESPASMNSENEGGEQIHSSVLEGKSDSEITIENNKPAEADKVDEKLRAIEERMSNLAGSEVNTIVIQQEENFEKVTASTEWNRQKEAELNEMLTKMMESKPIRNRKVVPSEKGIQDTKREQRGGFYDNYKGKRDEKLRGETAEKRAEKDAQFKAMQQVLEQRKAAMATANTTSAVRSKSSVSKSEKLRKSSTQSVNPKKESPKSVPAKKALPRASPSPVRKSLPSTPTQRAGTGISPAKTPCGTSSAGTTPTRRKPQPGPTVPQSSPKVEKIMQRSKPKPVKATQTDSRKSTRGIIEKQQQPISKITKTLKTKGQTISEKDSSKDIAKPSFYSKVTKKSSIVPLESKPFLRKGSGVGPATGPVVRAKAFSPLKESMEKPGNQIPLEENRVVTDAFDLVSQHSPDNILEPVDTSADLQSETQLATQELSDDIVKSEKIVTNSDDSLTRILPNSDDSFVRITESELNIEAEEVSTISPTAWVEEVEEHHELAISPEDSTCEISSVVNAGPVASASPRVRHSLSQMLLQEIAEPDMCEWGNAEIPPSIVYQKDAPKGLKRLLKFARKSKTDLSSTGLSSPSVFSEGEDDLEESKPFGKKNNDTLLRKAALHSSNYGQYDRDLAGPQRHYASQSNLNKFSAPSSSNRLQDHISGAATTTKATRSFFSLSAFKGNKPNETKFR